MNRPLFFTGANCPACVIAKKYADTHEIKYKECNVDERENAMLAAKYIIMGRPSLLILDTKGNPVRSFHGSSCFGAYVKWLEDKKYRV